MYQFEEELDYTKLKYVLYARKSTDDPQRQVRSIDDQIFDCKILKERLKLNIVDILQEKKSAKKPGQRPVFTQILKNLKSGKYDGIVAWNPDRLARNMKEGGEVIDMIDDGYIKDLKFVTHHFTNDANGKMLLGMAFVLSKQYSDDLSQKVTRGVRRKFSEGKATIPKHGYVNEGGLYKPDRKNFPLIVKAWEMRAESISLEQVADFLGKEGYFRETKEGRKIKVNEKILTDVFKDPFYYGVLMQSDQTVDLREIYDFEPAVSEENYWEVQSLTNRRIRPNKPHRAAFYPLKTMLICSYCNRNMYVGPSTGGSKKRYLNARCDTKGCLRPKKSVRMMVAFNFIYDYLEKGLNFTEAEYKRYSKNLTKFSEAEIQGNKIEIHRKQGLLAHVKKEIRERALGVLKPGISPIVIKENQSYIEDLELQEGELEKEIQKLQSKVSNPEQTTLSIEQFLNLSKNAATVVKSADAIVKDKICRVIFLNLTLDEEKVVSYSLREPYATLLKERENRIGRGDTI